MTTGPQPRSSAPQAAPPAVPRAAFGGDFAEAEQLYGQWRLVEARLADRAATLCEAAEYYAGAADGSRRALGALEGEVLRRFAVGGPA